MVRDVNDQLDALVETAKFSAQTLGEEFDEPGDDWFPLVFVANGENLTVVSVDPRIMTEQGKDALGYEILPEIIKREEAEAFVYLASTWSVSTDPDKYREWRKDHPDESLEFFPGRSENVTLIGSDGEEQIMCFAPIERDGVNPPTLGEWEVKSTEGLVGRMYGPMIAALADIRGEKRSGEEEN